MVNRSRYPSKPHRLTKVSSPVGSTDPLARFHVNVEFGDQVVLNTPPTRLDEPFVYDANGNILKSGNRTMAWTSFNKPYRMSKTHGVATVTRAQYHYGPDFNRTVKVKDTGENTPALETTLYIGKEYEHITDRTGSVKHRYTLSAGSHTIQIERDDNSNKDTPQYLLSDALGSTDVIVNASGEVEQQMAFDPWGQRLNVGGTSNQDIAVNSITNKGYTGHEMDDEVGLTNMNARIYDPVLGRFLSADPVLPDASDLQAFNRYAYVINNPLKYVDPTGNSALPACCIVEGQYRVSFGGLLNVGGFGPIFNVDDIEQRVLRDGRIAGLSSAEIDTNLMFALRGHRRGIRGSANGSSAAMNAMDGDMGEDGVGEGSAEDRLISVVGKDGVTYEVRARGPGIRVPIIGNSNYGRYAGAGHLGDEKFDNPADSPFAPIDAIDEAARRHDIGYYNSGIEFKGPFHDNPVRREIDQKFLDELNAIDPDTLTKLQKRYIQGANTLFGDGGFYDSPGEKLMRERRDSHAY